MKSMQTAQSQLRRLWISERFQELRTKQSEVTGIMRSTAVSTLDPWHLAQKFTSRPVLNQTFIEDTAPMSRILATGA